MSIGRQIWEKVFSGNVKRAVQMTRDFRKSCREEPTVLKKRTAPYALYLEPSLVSHLGHQLNLAGYYQRFLAELGFQVVVAHALESGLSPQLDWYRYFLVHHHTLEFGSVTSIRELESVEHYYEAEFKQLIDHFDPDICVFATIRFTNIVAAATVTSRDRATTKRKAIFGVMEANEVPDCDHPDIVSEAFKRAAHTFQKSETPHMMIAETGFVRDFLLDCGFHTEDVRIYPYVAARNICEFSHLPQSRPEKIHIGYVGGNRKVRNPELIADFLLSEMISDSVDWHVQFDLNYLKNARSPEVVSSIQELNKKNKICLYPTNLSEIEYGKLFNSLDFVVLPYSERYKQIGSGVLIEAIYLGVIPIMPLESNMNDLYSSLGGLAPVFRELSATAIGTAITDGINRIKDLKRDAEMVRDRWIKHPSSTEQWRAELTDWIYTGNQ